MLPNDPPKPNKLPIFLGWIDAVVSLCVGVTGILARFGFLSWDLHGAMMYTQPLFGMMFALYALITFKGFENKILRRISYLGLTANVAFLILNLILR